MDVTQRPFGGRLADKFGQQQGDLVISAASLQAMTANNACWIDRNGTLWPVGGAISMVNPGNIPTSLGGVDSTIDLSPYANAQWSLFYGAQGGSAGGHIGLAELWPTEPVPSVATIAPYVRDATGHYIAAGGLTQNIVRSVPGGIDAILDGVTPVSTPTTAGPFDAEDFEEIFVNLQFSGGGATSCTVTPYEIDAAGNQLQIGPAQSITASAAYAALSWGPGSNFGTGGLTAIQAMLPWRPQLVVSSPGAVTTRCRITGKRRLPLRRVGKVCPYIVFATPPTAATPIYMSIWGA